MLSRRRLPLLVAFPALYVGVAAIRAGEARPSAWLLVALAVAIALVGGRIPEGTEPGAARSRLWTASGLSVAVATAALTTRPAWAALARELGTLLAMFAALRSIHRIEGDVGLAPKASEAAAAPGFGPRAIYRAAIGVIALTWGTAALFDGLSLFGVAGEDAAPFVAASAGAMAIFALGATALLVSAVRRLELAVPPRALAAAGGAGAGLVLAITLALTGAVSADAAAALGGAIASALVVRLARTHDALALARHGRRALTLVLFGGPVAALASIAVEGRMSGASGAALGLAVVALLVGAISQKLEEPFLPVKGIMLDALGDAREATREREARAAMAHALMRIREACAVGLGPTAAPSPELWLLHPTRVLTVNAAGYLQERSAELPASLFEVALGEPHATLRTSVLRALEVRRADLRPLLAWLDQRDAIFATVIAESDDPDGLLVVPAGARTEELTLEEVRAAKLLADAFVAVSQATSARERHLGRERDLQERIDTLDDEAARLRHTIDLEAGRHALAAARLARPATVGIYSAASRMAYDALERRIAQDAPVVIVARAGIDPVPYIARAHLSGPRQSGPLVVVDGTSSREHDVDRWTDERTSPLALADRGLLFLVDGAALPREVQVLVARTIAERRAPWERATALDVVVALSTTSPAPELVESGRLAPELGARFAESNEPIVLPGLRDRPEDLRSIVADRLAREGLRVHGRPMGIDAAAYGRLVEYSFDGEDAELASIVTRLVGRAQGDVIRAADVDALGLVFPIEEAEPPRWPEGARAANRNDD
ncbi:MAG: two component, sigma54 specific, transcriptional regulator, Fis family [Labilithrix sp.]|nr:two component, sigma54 specific, transcriptional regulator, Fis family [Labilithrix sp.]